MAKFGFSTDEYEYTGGGNFDPVPDGEYTLKATEAEEQDTKAGTGSYLSVTFEIVSGEFKGRKIWNNFNINNPSEKAQKIGREQVVGWARACGKPNANDTDQLLERPFQAMVKIEKSVGYKDKNVISAFLIDKKDEPARSEKPVSESEKDSKIEETVEKPKKLNPWDE